MFQELFEELSNFPDQERIKKICFPEKNKKCPYLLKFNGQFHCFRNRHERIKIEEENGNKKSSCQGCFDIVFPKRNVFSNVGFIHKVIIPDERKRGIIKKVELSDSKISFNWRSFEGEEKEPIEFELENLAIRTINGFDKRIIFESLEWGPLVSSMEISESINKLEKILKKGL